MDGRPPPHHQSHQSDPPVRRDLRSCIHGPVLVDGDDGYDDLRLGWNRTFDSRPAAIVVADDTHDVRAAVSPVLVHMPRPSSSSTTCWMSGCWMCRGLSIANSRAFS